MNALVLRSVKTITTLVLSFSFVTGFAMKESGISTEEAQSTYHRMALGGENFDVPVSYFYRDFKAAGGGRLWPRPRYIKRVKVDVFTITGILPEMAPYTLENADEFEKPGWGRLVQASISPGVMDWTYYFSYTFARLEALPASEETPRGFKRFYDPKTMKPALKEGFSQSRNFQKGDEVFFSADKPGQGLVRIVCNPMASYPYPGCEVITEYKGKYRLQYWFSRDHLARWLEVDRAVKAVFDKFVEHASQDNR